MVCYTCYDKKTSIEMVWIENININLILKIDIILKLLNYYFKTRKLFVEFNKPFYIKLLEKIFLVLLLNYNNFLRIFQ